MAKKKKEKKAPIVFTTLEQVLAAVNKKYGTHSIARASDSEALAKIIRIPTGIFGYDVMHGGGTPTGRMTVLYGNPSGGKSALALRTAGAFQRHCRVCGKPMYSWDELTMTKKLKRCCKMPEPMRVVWFDVERAWANDWSVRLGVDTKHSYVIRAEYAEQGIDIADAVIRSGQCDLLVVDSVAALTPSEEIEKSTEEWQRALQARLLNKAMRKWTSAQNAGGLGELLVCSVLLVNQLRTGMGQHGSYQLQPGGKGIGFHSSIESQVRKVDVTFDDLGRPIGHLAEVTTTKNKTSPPLRSCQINLQFVHYGNRRAGSTDYAHQVITLAEVWGLVKKEGSWLTLAKGVKIQGEAAAGEYLELPENRPLLNLLAKKVWEQETAWADGAAYGQNE